MLQPDGDSLSGHAMKQCEEIQLIRIMRYIIHQIQCLVNVGLRCIRAARQRAYSSVEFEFSSAQFDEPSDEVIFLIDFTL